MSVHDFERDQDAPGEELRSRAANVLEQRYGAANVESRQMGKKADVYFQYDDHGRSRRLYVEAKDYTKPLSRNDVVHIWTDYSGIVERTKPAELLIVTRNGLTPDADAYVNTEQTALRHRTIWQLENDALQIMPYVRTLAGIFKEDQLHEYYVEARAYRESDKSTYEPFIDRVRAWIDNEETKPIAILAGYGAGKSCFARRLIADQAERAMTDPHARRPVLIKLGEMVHGYSLKALLGGMFTAEPPIAGYSFQTFMQLNSAGRFVIVLDGFDEMKHAMNWADFRATVREFNTLVNEKAKVILIGRPSAFTSDIEHNLVIRGLRYEDGNWPREINWPEYEEYRLDGFTRKERRYFVPRYLAVVERHNARIERRPPSLDWASSRAAEVDALVIRDASILSRPLHSRILVEVAADRSTDLRQFSPGVSSWKLYSAFYKRLADRETEPPTAKEHEIYSSILADGVQLCLSA